MPVVTSSICADEEQRPADPWLTTVPLPRRLGGPGPVAAGLGVVKELETHEKQKGSQAQQGLLPRPKNLLKSVADLWPQVTVACIEHLKIALDKQTKAPVTQLL